MRKAERAALLASVLVPISIITSLSEPPLWWVMLLFVMDPVVLIALVWAILRDPAPPPLDLPPGHEWGYADRPGLRSREANGA